MVREELKRQVSDGGKDFIDAYSDGKYRNNWFDTNALYDDYEVHAWQYSHIWDEEGKE